MNALADIGFLLAWAVSVLKATMHWLAEAYEPPLLSAPTAYPNRIARHRQEAESRAPEATCVGCRLVYTDSVHFRNIQKDAGRSSNSRNPYRVVLVPLGKIPQELRNLSESVLLDRKARTGTAPQESSELIVPA